jgi:hypothetical protein
MINITDYRHPSWWLSQDDWEKWRLTYAGGEAFKLKYLQKFTNREDNDDFNRRSAVTPIPAFAKAAVNDIRNSIFQRLRDIVRVGGSSTYQSAVAGERGGVDRRGSTMNSFLGMKVLTDLLVMGKTGVYVDNSLDQPLTMADQGSARPYLYSYPVEDIVGYTCMRADDPAELQSVVLRDTVMQFDEATLLPTSLTKRYRRLWVEGGGVKVQMYDEGGRETTLYELELTRIPFVILDIGDSLLRDVCQHQIALLNLGSGDVNYALMSGFPIYVEEADPRGAGAHLKQAGNGGTAMAGGQGAATTEKLVGASHGMSYSKGATPPSFINPSSEPLLSSMKLQEKLESDIRKLVNLSVQTLATRASAESKSLDNDGLEAGLSFIGLVLEGAERKIVDFWTAYEERNEAKRQIAVVKYPDRYSLRGDSDRIEESTKLSSLMSQFPGQTAKKETAKLMVQSLLGGRVSVTVLETINKEIDAAPFTTSNPDTLQMAVEKGLCGEKTASLALGFGPDEYLQAQADHAKRIARIAEAQGISAGARGVSDLSASANDGKDEKASAKDTTKSDSTEAPVRGEGK